MIEDIMDNILSIKKRIRVFVLALTLSTNKAPYLNFIVRYLEFQRRYFFFPGLQGVFIRCFLPCILRGLALLACGI